MPPITKTIQVWRTRHVGHCWRSKDELISDILRWTPSHGWAKVERPAKTYIQQLCADTGCSLEDLLRVMDDWDRWRERFREIHAPSVTWWWWYTLTYFFYYNIANKKRIFAYITLKKVTVTESIVCYISQNKWCSAPGNTILMLLL